MIFKKNINFYIKLENSANYEWYQDWNLIPYSANNLKSNFFKKDKSFLENDKDLKGIQTHISHCPGLMTYFSNLIHIPCPYDFSIIRKDNSWKIRANPHVKDYVTSFSIESYKNFVPFLNKKNMYGTIFKVRLPYIIYSKEKNIFYNSLLMDDFYSIELRRKDVMFLPGNYIVSDSKFLGGLNCASLFFVIDQTCDEVTFEMGDYLTSIYVNKRFEDRIKIHLDKDDVPANLWGSSGKFQNKKFFNKLKTKILNH